MTISFPRDPTTVPSIDLGAPHLHDDDLIEQGELLTISERLVVSPSWGRLRTHPVEEGQELDAGAVIGVIREAGEEHPLVCRVASEFVAWLALENERVPPGRALARIRPTHDSEAHSTQTTSEVHLQ